MQTICTEYDIVIVGAGVVGLVAACALSHSSLRIALIASQIPISKQENDLRVNAIRLSTVTIFQKLNLWSGIQAQGISPFKKIYIRNESTQSEINFDSTEINKPFLGYIIENRVIQKALYDYLKALSLIEFICPATLENLVIDNEKAIIKLNDERSISAKLVIAADGIQSSVRKFASIEIDSPDYQQKALIAQVQTELSHQQIARQHFLSTGPLAFLPLDDEHHCSIVWSAAIETISMLETINDDEFCKILTQKAYQLSLGTILKVNHRASFYLKKQLVKNYIKPHIVLIGDAAHTVHPLAGQGLNLGIADAFCLAQVILRAIQKSQNISSLPVLRQYERERKTENFAMSSIINSLEVLFSSKNKMAHRLLPIGLQITDRFSFLKRKIIQIAEGEYF